MYSDYYKQSKHCPWKCWTWEQRKDDLKEEHQQARMAAKSDNETAKLDRELEAKLSIENVRCERDHLAMALDYSKWIQREGKDSTDKYFHQGSHYRDEVLMPVDLEAFVYYDSIWWDADYEALESEEKEELRQKATARRKRKQLKRKTEKQAKKQAAYRFVQSKVREFKDFVIKIPL